MKYLRLEPTADGIRYAKTLIGSRCDDSSSEDPDYCLESVRDTGRFENSSFGIRGRDGCGYDCCQVIIPFPRIVFSLFNAMENNVSVYGIEDNKPFYGGIFSISEGDSDSFEISVRDSDGEEYSFFEEDLTIDLCDDTVKTLHGVDVFEK